MASGRVAPVPVDVLFFAIVGPVSGMLEVPWPAAWAAPRPPHRNN